MDVPIINEFCWNRDVSLLQRLSPTSVQLLVTSAYTSLNQKRGNQDLSLLVLNALGETASVGEYIVYKGTMDNLSPYESLRRVGIATIPIIQAADLPKLREEFVDTLREFPEYIRSNNSILYTLGGFAALGNPASFHNPLVRKLRIMCRRGVVPLFQQIVSDMPLPSRWNLEMLVDRMMYRYQSQQPSAESWHRDVIPKERIGVDDEVYGGWVNLDTTDQYFSCIPGSHLSVKLSDLRDGFAAVPKDQIDIVSAHKHKFRVPPGHMIIFPQYILHEVVSSKAKHNMMRLFLGWSMTTRDDFIHPDMLHRLETQAIVPLPSGQLPPVYAASHGSYYLHKAFKPVPDRNHTVSLIEWSKDTFKPITLVNKVGKNGPYRVVKRYMDSLQHYGFNMYPAYTPEEIALYRPSPITPEEIALYRSTPEKQGVMWDRVYKRTSDYGPQTHDVSIPSLTVVTIPKNIELIHVEQDQQYPGGGDYPVNPYTFFVMGRTPYWHLSENYVDYRYKTRRSLSLIYIKDYNVLHDWLRDNVRADLFALIPYNEDPSFPYEAPGETYAWDYVEMGIVCSLFGMDGLIRSDEIVLCSDYMEKLVFQDKDSMGVVPVKDYEGPSIYYTPSDQVLRGLREEPAVQKLISRFGIPLKGRVVTGCNIL